MAGSSAPSNTQCLPPCWEKTGLPSPTPPPPSSQHASCPTQLPACTLPSAPPPLQGWGGLILAPAGRGEGLWVAPVPGPCWQEGGGHKGPQPGGGEVGGKGVPISGLRPGAGPGGMGVAPAVGGGGSAARARHARSDTPPPTVTPSVVPQRAPAASPSAHNLSGGLAERPSFPRGVASRSTFHAGQLRPPRDPPGGPPSPAGASQGPGPPQRGPHPSLFSKFTSKFVRR